MERIDTSKLEWYEPAFNAEKFRELLVYVARKCEADPTFGAIKLNKIFYYADFAAFRQKGEPITGATYYKASEGPAPREMLTERRALIDSGEAWIAEAPHFTGPQRRLIVAPGREPDCGLFAPGELRIVDEVTAFFRGKTEREASEYSRGENGWVLARDQENIPYETAYLSSAPLSQENEEMLRRAAALYAEEQKALTPQ